MAKTITVERRRFWQELFAKRAALGLSVAQVCQEAGVSQATFYAWRNRLQSSSPGSAAIGSRRGLTKTASPLVPAVKYVIRRMKMDEAAKLAEFALGCESSADILERCQDFARQIAPSLFEDN